MSRLCTVCARAGSKGVKNKNIRQLLGQPLIVHTIRQARAANVFDAIAVSSDSSEILAAAEAAGADYLICRPDALATDTAPKIPVIRHCVEEAERMSGRTFDTVVDLDATSPLRLPEDIRSAVELCESNGSSNVITAMPSRRSPYFNLVEVSEDGHIALAKKLARPIERRQDAPKTYDMNASIYVWRRSVLAENESLFLDGTRLYVMPEERSIDIDSELDFEIVEMIARKRASLS
jgi:N-acylneuraminate cytidylyltransferase/CMP-N,N'-diacetyllegionaminic acid synthase